MPEPPRMASCQALDELGDEAGVEDVQDDVEAGVLFFFRRSISEGDLELHCHKFHVQFSSVPTSRHWRSPW